VARCTSHGSIGFSNFRGSEDAALVGDAGGQHPVEGADAVGGDDDEAVAKVVDVADLTAAAGLAPIPFNEA
jgi:hypothetical protein